MPSPSASTWPTSGGGHDVVTPATILWSTVKTEEEEYLDKLQSKLSRIMKSGPISSALRPENVDVEPDDLTDVSPALAHDEDPGLHLLYGFPSAGRRSPSPTPRSQSEPTSTSAPRPRLVRFRSRVRITSGVHPSTSGASSSCESISSSISAPLQGLRRESNAKAVPLSGMLSADAASAWLRGLGRTHRSTRETQRRTVDERSPLSFGSHSRVHGYTEPDDDQDDSAEYERMRAAARKTEEDVMFGRWPWRLMNRHWWWWKIEPILCCCSRFDIDPDIQ